MYDISSLRVKALSTFRIYTGTTNMSWSSTIRKGLKVWV